MIRVFNQYLSAKALLLVLSEGILIVAALIGAALVRAWGSARHLSTAIFVPDVVIQIGIALLVLQVCFYYNDLYAPDTVCSRAQHRVRFLQALSVACLLMTVVNCTALCIAPGIFMDGKILLITVALLVCSEPLMHSAVDYAWRSAGKPPRVAVIGTGDIALTVLREIRARRDLRIDIAGFISSGEPCGYEESVLGHPVIGTVDEIERLIRCHNLSRIVVALENQRGHLPVRTLVNLRVQGIHIEEAHTTISNLTGRIWLPQIRPSWFIYSDGFRRPHTAAVVKRLLDILLSFIGLVLSAPIMLITAVFIRLESRGSILYRQDRVGLRGKTFEILKFRSMRVNAEQNGSAQWAAKDDPRVTRVGRFIRKYRVDELPQLWNVLRGEMSLVGPRPERPVFVNQLRELIPYYDERHLVRPGLTGWAQIRYEYGATVADAGRKLEYDLFYLQNMSTMFDCVIVAQTVQTILFHQGAR